MAIRQAGSTTGFRAFLVLREVRAMDDKKPSHAAKPSTGKASAEQLHEVLQSILNERPQAAEPSLLSLSSVRSEYETFCDDKGGPIEIEGFTKINDYRNCCRHFPVSKFRNIIERWQSDAISGIRHWPAMAFATNHYQFLQREFERYGKPPSPTEVRELLVDIAKTAEGLRLALIRLQSFSYQISDGSNPFAVPHLAWIDEFIAQAMAGIISGDVIQEEAVLLRVHFDRLEFLKRLMTIEAAATASIGRLDLPSLKHKRGAHDRALRRLVSMAKSIWKSLTGRRPSVNKVNKKGIETPEFVLFVQGLAEIAGGPVPSLKQVAVAFKPFRPPE
jgi:hypothetical protein